jgi:hypothetical protein
MMLSICGLVCDSCPIHLVTLENNGSQLLTMRRSIAEQCTKLYGMEMKEEDITDCDGCTIRTGRLFSGCRNCRVRACAMQKDLENCAYCSDYACDLLAEIFRHEPGARSRLDEIRQGHKE